MEGHTLAQPKGATLIYTNATPAHIPALTAPEGEAMSYKPFHLGDRVEAVVE